MTRNGFDPHDFGEAVVEMLSRTTEHESLSDQEQSS